MFDMNGSRDVDVARDTGGGPDVALAATPPAQLPAVAPSREAAVRFKESKVRWLRLGLLLAFIAMGAGGGTFWWFNRIPPLPAGIASGNGRLEADPIDIASKFAGRIAELRVDEGAMVKAGQVVALMDTRDLEASLKKAQAQVEQAKKVIAEANANVAQAHTQVVLAEQQMERADTLLKNGWITRELFDQRQQQLRSAQAAELAAEARGRAAESFLNAAEHDVELYKVNIADNMLVAPRDGRIEYRIANVGEVLPAGGKVFTMLDVGYVYMDIYLPTAAAGQVSVDDEARIVLDAWPERPIPSAVSFIASQAQFTPKMVETRTEREKLMFRVRVRIDPDLSRVHADRVRSGVPGMAYVKFDGKVQWPERLQGRP